MTRRDNDSAGPRSGIIDEYAKGLERKSMPKDAAELIKNPLTRGYQTPGANGNNYDPVKPKQRRKKKAKAKWTTSEYRVID